MASRGLPGLDPGIVFVVVVGGLAEEVQRTVDRVGPVLHQRDPRVEPAVLDPASAPPGRRRAHVLTKAGFLHFCHCRLVPLR